MKLDIYEAIGGRAKLNAAVKRFYEKVLADPQLQPFFARADMDGLRSKQLMFLTMLLGGASDAPGHPDVRSAHAESRQKGLSNENVSAFFSHFRAALEETGVTPDLIARVMEKLESARGEVLGR